VGYQRRTRILEHLTAGSMVRVLMILEQIFDRLVGDLTDCRQDRLGSAFVDRIGDDHPRIRDHEPGAVKHIAERIDRVRNLGQFLLFKSRRQLRIAAPETANVSPIAAAAITSFLIMDSSLSMINISGCKHEKKHISSVGRRDILVIF
jgi:hypothetical protein